MSPVCRTGCPASRRMSPDQKLAGSASIESAWAETLLFGSLDDLRLLLDGGFNPNSATKGGTTALMMAAPDVEKMKLLLDRGADVNARAKSKYSALMVAALYPETTPAIRMLLDRGAQVRLPKGRGFPLDKVSTMFLASFAGNTEILSRLRDVEIQPMTCGYSKASRPLVLRSCVARPKSPERCSTPASRWMPSTTPASRRSVGQRSQTRLRSAGF
jgi:ankyrin repeat protein